MLWALAPWQSYLPGHFMAKRLRHKSHHSILNMAKNLLQLAQKPFSNSGSFTLFVRKDWVGELGWIENTWRPMAVRHLLRNPKLLPLKETKLI